MTDFHKSSFSDSAIDKGLKQPLNKVSPIWEDFPEHSEEIFHLVSAMPRQSFEFPDNAALPASHCVERTTSDEKLKVEWTVNCYFNPEASPLTPELFYKIEAFVIRPLIRKQDSDLKTCLPIGTLEEIAELINFQGESLDEIEAALSFGSGIKIELRISDQQDEKRKKANSKLRTGYMSYTPFEWGTSTTDFSKETELTGNISGENICYLFPTCAYADVLGGSLQIEKGSELKLLSPRALRLLEILYWKALVDEQGKQSYAGDSPKFRVLSAEIAELFPLEDELKFEELLKEFDLLQADQNF